MNAEQFAYWMQGFVELHGEQPTAEQWESIKDHLKLVFEKVTPQRVMGPNIASPALPNFPVFDRKSPWPYDMPKITCAVSTPDCSEKAWPFIKTTIMAANGETRTNLSRGR